MPVRASSPPAARRAAATLEQLRSRGRLQVAAGLLGPAFVASAAYVDPGNIATNFAAGREHGYQLLWVVVVADLIAILVQYVTSKVGLATGHSLPELCRTRFGPRVNLILWVQGEIVAMATDLAEFTGAAIGMRLLFGIALLPAGALTACVAFAVLALDQRGYRRFELAVIALVALVGLGFCYLFVVSGARAAGIAGGLAPRLGGGDSAGLAAAIVGATVMPHAVYLHSALHKNRVAASDARGQRTLLAFNKLDCFAGLGLAGVVNLAMLCVAAALSHRAGTQLDGLTGAYARLGQLAGGSAALVFAVALMASGLSSSAVGTYAGQVIMAGFTSWRVPLLVRRTVTMLPSLLILGCMADAGQALVYSQVVLSFGIPFALIPLVVIARERAILGAAVNHQYTTALLCTATVLISALNAYVIYQFVAGLA
jgi:manganese transport protein